MQQMFSFLSRLQPDTRGKPPGNHSPSRSSQKDILVWPRPMVYLPAAMPSNFSSSVWSTHCTRNVRSVLIRGVQRGATLQMRSLLEQTCLAGEVQLNGLDTDVLGTGSHVYYCCELWWREEASCYETGGVVFTAGLST